MAALRLTRFLSFSHNKFLNKYNIYWIGKRFDVFWNFLITFSTYFSFFLFWRSHQKEKKKWKMGKFLKKISFIFGGVNFFSFVFIFILLQQLSNEDEEEKKTPPKVRTRQSSFLLFLSSSSGSPQEITAWRRIRKKLKERIDWSSPYIGHSHFLSLFSSSKIGGLTYFSSFMASNQLRRRNKKESQGCVLRDVKDPPQT